MKKKAAYLKTLLFAFLLAPTVALAVKSGDITDPELIRGTPSIKDIIVQIINYILSFAAAIAVLLIIYGGIVYMTSSGDEKKTTSAKGIITGAVIGLLVVLFALVIIKLTGSFATTVTTTP